MAEYREWKGKWSDGDLFDDHDGRKADGLYESKDVNSTRLDVTKIDQIGLIFHRHWQDVQTLYELQSAFNTVQNKFI